MTHMKLSTVKVAVLGFCALALVGCGTTGQTAIKGANTVRALNSGSYSGAGLNERVTNCLIAAVDTNNRGGPCSR